MKIASIIATLTLLLFSCDLGSGKVNLKDSDDLIPKDSNAIERIMYQTTENADIPVLINLYVKNLDEETEQNLKGYKYRRYDFVTSDGKFNSGYYEFVENIHGQIIQIQKPDFLIEEDDESVKKILQSSVLTMYSNKDTTVFKKDSKLDIKTTVIRKRIVQ